ncbi:MAG: 4Fe-4S dicluster domain-containing protein [Promethearchaeota archaeon]
MVRTRLTPSASFIRELISLPEGEIIEACLACGVCTASCAVASGSHYNPRQIMQKILVGARDVVLQSEQPWLCKACFLCDTTCQYGVRLSDVFKIVRKLAIREGFAPTVFQQNAQTLLTDGWLMKDAYSDFVADERKELGLSSRLTQNKRYTRDVKSKYFDTGG